MKPYVVKCKSLFRGNASVGSHIIDHCAEKKIPLKIQVGKCVMTVPLNEFDKFFTFGGGPGKKYIDQQGGGYYTLKYIKFKEDSFANEEVAK